MKFFLGIVLVINLYAEIVFAAPPNLPSQVPASNVSNISEQNAPAQKGKDQNNTGVHESFIDKRGMALPVAPEVQDQNISQSNSPAAQSVVPTDAQKPSAVPGAQAAQPGQGLQQQPIDIVTTNKPPLHDLSIPPLPSLDEEDEKNLPTTEPQIVKKSSPSFFQRIFGNKEAANVQDNKIPEKSDNLPPIPTPQGQIPAAPPVVAPAPHLPAAPTQVPPTPAVAPAPQVPAPTQVQTPALAPATQAPTTTPVQAQVPTAPAPTPAQAPTTPPVAPAPQVLAPAPAQIPAPAPAPQVTMEQAQIDPTGDKDVPTPNQISMITVFRDKYTWQGGLKIKMVPQSGLDVSVSIMHPQIVDDTAQTHSMLKRLSTAKVNKINPRLAYNEANNTIPHLALKGHHIAKKAITTTKPVNDFDQIKFIQAEVKMLSVPDDDVILGKVTYKAKFADMGYSQYLTIYESYRDNVKRQNMVKDIEEFITYHRKIDGNDIPYIPDKQLFALAVDNIKSGNIDTLRALANNYKLLNMIDSNGNGLLHISAYSNDYNLTKWLIMRGLDVNAMNYDAITPLEIADHEQSAAIVNLLKSANAG